MKFRHPLVYWDLKPRWAWILWTEQVEFPCSWVDVELKFEESWGVSIPELISSISCITRRIRMIRYRPGMDFFRLDLEFRFSWEKSRFSGINRQWMDSCWWKMLGLELSRGYRCMTAILHKLSYRTQSKDFFNHAGVKIPRSRRDMLLFEFYLLLHKHL